MYVRNRQRGGLGRLAGPYRFSGLGRMRGLRGLRGSRLGQDSFDAWDVGQGTPLDDGSSGLISASPSVYSGSVLSPGGSFAPSGLTPLDASLISQGITSGTLLASKALTPTPTVTYNPLTGAYTSTGGAVMPSSITGSLGSLGSLSAYLPYLLIGGVLIAAVSLMKR
jgi:hypothetical protein